ncbi:hypothetical protein LCI18_001985 [Fusarium solani-melongenae]|uniref:Uncharacterized protein n=1 Tax=Fusarium solani subsp. cucurbitae TaxID=2747967 RepID=A0ACD3YQ40_FUSSC|nr:hypothetical protein LCI18_001985 [Fusarium solani-melongenae]
MVSYTEIKASNSVINDVTAPSVAVFVGGTSGIGKLTVKALVATGSNIRIYLIGRKSSEERSHAFIEELRVANPKAEVIWTEGDVSLLAETKRLCEVIKSKESRIDLFLAYYSRMLFILHLLPLLREAEAPRVVSVLGGGMETTSLELDDIELKKPENFGPRKVQLQVLTMNTTTLDKLAAENPDVTFIHSWPGWVNTGNVNRGVDQGTFMSWFVWLILEPLISLFSFSDEESAQRHLFQSTSAAFGGRGVPWSGKQGVNSQEKQENGLFLVNYKCNCTPNAKVVSALREKAQKRVWDHTQEVLGPHL